MACAHRLSKPDQERVFPNSVSFDCPEDQEAFVREWAQKRTGLACDFKVKFYPGRYAPEKGELRTWGKAWGLSLCLSGNVLLLNSLWKGLSSEPLQGEIVIRSFNRGTFPHAMAQMTSTLCQALLHVLVHLLLGNRQLQIV
jgi:hypothetical protein